MHCFKNIQQDLMTFSRSLVERTDFNRASHLIWEKTTPQHQYACQISVLGQTQPPDYLISLEDKPTMDLKK